MAVHELLIGAPSIAVALLATYFFVTVTQRDSLEIAPEPFISSLEWLLVGNLLMLFAFGGFFIGLVTNTPVLTAVIQGLSTVYILLVAVILLRWGWSLQ